MTSHDLLTAYRGELDAGYASMKSGDLDEAFRRFERAHILGQRSTRLHLRAHLAMLKVARRRADRREIMGQLTRIAAAALFSRIWVPAGNTGGANVSALRSRRTSSAFCTTSEAAEPVSRRSQVARWAQAQSRLCAQLVAKGALDQLKP